MRESGRGLRLGKPLCSYLGKVSRGGLYRISTLPQQAIRKSFHFFFCGGGEGRGADH